jgi:hypothetical protein
MSRRRQARVPTKAGAGSSALPYWISPYFIPVATILIGILLFVTVPDDLFRSELRVPTKASNWDAVIVYGYCLIAIVAGVALGSFILPRASDMQSQILRENSSVRLESFFKTLGYSSLFLSSFSYVIFFASGDLSLSVLSNTLQGTRGAIYQLKASMVNTPGLTSFMTLAPWWFVYVIYKFLVLRKNLTAIEIAASIILLSCAVFRGFATNERLAIIQLAIPSVVLMPFLKSKWSKTARFLLVFGPIIGITALFFIFAVTEYFRSWAPFYAKVSRLDFFDWVSLRLGAYYTTSINNGLVALDTEMNGHGYYFFNGIYRLPFISTSLGLDRIREAVVDQFTLMLSTKLNPEFNNQGGVVVFIWDLGYIWGGLMLVFFGLFANISYNLARHGQVSGYLFYPFFFSQFLELTRVWNFFSPIAVLNLIFVSACLFLIPRKRTLGIAEGKSAVPEAQLQWATGRAWRRRSS